jgi:trimethylamine--corrinoid protein Co-methyltransferase
MNAKSPQSPFGDQILNDSQLTQIHHASLEILRRTGVRVCESEALDLLGDAGCLISDGDLVKFPAAVVEEALLHAPSRIVLCSSTGEPRSPGGPTHLFRHRLGPHEHP